MKYTVMSASQYEVVGIATSPIEALKLKYAYETRNTTDEVIIRDENRVEFDPDSELEIFVDDLMLATDEGRNPMSIDEARVNLEEYTKAGLEVPEQLTAELLSWLWNKSLANEADLTDVEPDLPAPAPEASKRTRALQNLADVAKANTDSKYKAFEKARTAGNLGELDKTYREYLESQAFYEGVTAAILAAGYAIETEVGTCKMTVTKA
jgi:hypothetical protein